MDYIARYRYVNKFGDRGTCYLKTNGDIYEIEDGEEIVLTTEYREMSGFQIEKEVADDL